MKRFVTLLLAAGLLLCGGYAHALTTDEAKAPAAAAPASSDEESYDLTYLVPDYPAFSSMRFQDDLTRFYEGRLLEGTPRWEQARQDADYNTMRKRLVEAALGTVPSKEKIRNLETLLVYVVRVGGKSVHSVKNRAFRARPFVYLHTYTCEPKDEESLRKQSSYPSGHTGSAWSMALALCELFPDREREILSVGFELGQSRVICGYHWQSDVDAARLAAGATFAKLHGQKKFQELMAKAKAELEGLRAAR